ncbi:hypothetical protein [Lysobacter sp. CA199]|uniref:hypothetical protein n=1 Tax=Lysobacter sp. CA199 TaxID=3455608 RepID=UPI003F8D08E2
MKSAARATADLVALVDVEAKLRDVEAKLRVAVAARSAAHLAVLDARKEEGEDSCALALEWSGILSACERECDRLQRLQRRIEAAVALECEPSKALVLKVRAAFVASGRTFTGWCEQNGIRVTNARQALLGSWDGPKGQALRHQIIKAAGAKVVRP